MMKGVGTFWISMDFTQIILSGSCEKLNNLQRRRDEGFRSETKTNFICLRLHLPIHKPTPLNFFRLPHLWSSWGSKTCRRSANKNRYFEISLARSNKNEHLQPLAFGSSTVFFPNTPYAILNHPQSDPQHLWTLDQDLNTGHYRSSLLWDDMICFLFSPHYLWEASPEECQIPDILAVLMPEEYCKLLITSSVKRTIWFPPLSFRQFLAQCRLTYTSLPTSTLSLSPSI